MTIIDIITKKKNKEELTYEEIKYAIDGYLSGNIKDYQMSSLLMAITINGMTNKETFDLTEIMICCFSFDKLSIIPLWNIVKYILHFSFHSIILLLFFGNHLNRFKALYPSTLDSCGQESYSAYDKRCIDI